MTFRTPNGRLLGRGLQRSLATLVLAAAAFGTAAAEPPALSPTLFLPGDDTLGPAAGQQHTPEIARGGDIALAVWVDARTEMAGVSNFGSGPYDALDLGSMWDIYAARIDAEGNLIDTTPIIVAQQTFNQTRPSVAWNGENWLVVWNGQQPVDEFNLWSHIFAARVAPDGTVLDNPPITVDLAATMDGLHEPTVSSDGTNWFVVWRDLDQQAGVYTLDGARIAPDGTLLDPGGVYIRHPDVNSYPTYPDVDFLQDRYLVTFNESGMTVWGQFIAPDLSPIGARFRVSPAGRTSGAGNIANDGTQFFVVVSDATNPGARQVWATLVQLTGQVSAGIQVSSSSGFGCYQPVTAFDGTNFFVTYERGVVPPINLRGAIVTPTGSVLQNEMLVVSGAPHSDYSAIAGLPGGGVVVLWEDDRNDNDDSPNTEVADIMATTMTSGGTVGERYTVSVGAPRQTRAKSASSDGGFLLTLLSETAAVHRVLAWRLGQDGVPLDDAPIEVVSGGWEIQHPSVAWDGARYLVVWENAFENLVYGKRVAADGTVLDAQPIALLDGNWPDVAATSGLFLVVSSHEPINHIRYPMAIRFDGATGAIVGSQMQLGGNHSEFPHVAALADHWVVTWQRRPTHDNPTPYAMGAIVDTQGASGGAFSVASGTQRLPTVAASADTAIFIYGRAIAGVQRENIHARRILSSGAFVDTELDVSTEIHFQRRPAAAWDGTQFVTTWVDDRDAGNQPRGDIYGARIAGDGPVLDPGGFAVVNDTIPETFAFAGGHGGIALLGGSIFRADGPFVNHRVGYRISGQVPASAEDLGDAAGDGLSADDGLRLQVWPNPATTTSTIGFRMPSTGAVEAAIYDVTGAVVRTLHAGTLPAGDAQLEWNGRDGLGRQVAPGVYFARVGGAGTERTIKLLRR